MRLINGQELELNLVGDALRAHFDDDNNYAKYIITEWEGLPYTKYIKPDSVILDIGANVGLFALHVAPYADKIICVEPTPAHMQIQKEFISMPHVYHEQSALNHYTGKARFRTEPVNTTMNCLRDAPDSYEVDCITLKDLCEKYKLDTVDFCKVDIEGGEFQALTVERIKEASDIIKSFFVELHPRTIESQMEIGARFEQAGYKVDMVDYNGSIYCYK